MKITPLARTGDFFRVLYQDKKSLKGFTVGISGSIAAIWGLKTDEEQVSALNKIAEAILDVRGFDVLDGTEKVYTTYDTQPPFDLAVNEIAQNFCKEVK